MSGPIDWDAAHADLTCIQADAVIIGVTGPARAGKGTVARMIIDLVHEVAPRLVVKREGFSDRLKLSAARALGFDPGDVAEAIALMDDLKVGGFVVADLGWRESPTASRLASRRITGREFLQRYGTESHRDVFGADFWTERVLPDPYAPRAGRPDHFDVLVIDDLRFVNEAERIKASGGVIWRVEREHTIVETAHVSEAGLPAYLVDRVIDNTGDLDALRVATSEALAFLR